jgi:hypothetical protein
MGDGDLSQTREILQSFTSYYQRIMGSKPQNQPSYDLTQIIEGCPDLNILDANFFEDEIKRVVFALPKGKASGLDEFSSEFF